MNKQKGFINILVVLALVFLLGITSYYFIHKKAVEPSTKTTPDNQEEQINTISTNTLPTQTKNNIANPTQTPVTTKQSSVSVNYTGALKTYKNSKYGFEVKYPDNLTMEEGKIEPNTYFIVWKNPSYSNVRVNIIYINEGKSALTSSELSKGTQIQIGTKMGYKFTSNTNPLYWVDTGTYALAIYSEKPQTAGVDYNQYLQISTFKF